MKSLQGTLRSALALSALTTAAARAEIPAPLDRLSISFGDFYPTVETRVAANGSGIMGSDVDFQRDLGLSEHRSLPAFRVDALLFDSQGLSVGGYVYSRQASARLNRDLVFDDDVFRVNAYVDAKLTLRIYHAEWRWWLAPDDSDVVGFGLGAAYYDLRGTIAAGLSINGGSVHGHGSAEGDAIAPMLTLGWRHSFNEAWRAYADVSGVRKPFGTLQGHLLNGTLGVEFMPWKNAGLALEYSANNLDLKAQKESWEGRARIHFYGPAAFVRLRF
jgi:hypothetical protein